jgi:hypothetical protein
LKSASIAPFQTARMFCVIVVAALFTGEHPTQIGVLLDGRTTGVATCDRE